MCYNIPPWQQSRSACWDRLMPIGKGGDKMTSGSSKLVAAFSLLLVAAASPASAQNAMARQFHVNPQRLQESLEKLSEFGRNPEGGVTRLGYSETQLAARKYVSELMEQAGLQVRSDAAGNLFGRREGSEKLPVLLFGSHIDSVLKGGNFDGDVGSIGAVEVAQALNQARVKTRHPLEVVIWENEEGNHFGISTMGSGIAAGVSGLEILDRKDEQGLTVADWLRNYGQDPAHLTDARIARGALAGYLELHIEQGPNLDERKIPIGVVQGIVGLKRWKCVAKGFANHAGTTPMNRRRDALAAASRDLLAVREVVRGEYGGQVGTVGYMKVAPGAVNVIPGLAEFPVERRDLNAAKIEQMWEKIQAQMKKVDTDEHVETSCTPLDDIAPARTDESMQAAIREAAKSLGLATMDLPSGAVQDAQQMAKLAPFGMIFVPSRDGISHSPNEFTSWQDVANGTEVLYRAILRVDADRDRK
jgi:beta-ureidopropionase / N-carbamoyl-L-amino-acid hydrolase